MPARPSARAPIPLRGGTCSGCRRGWLGRAEMGRTAYGGRQALPVELTTRLADGERLERKVESPQADAAGDWSKTVPRRHKNAGNRPRGPRGVNGLREQVGLPSDGRRSVLHTDNAKADETFTSRAEAAVDGRRVREGTPTRPEQAASTKYRDRSNGRQPVNDRLREVRPQSRTARISHAAARPGHDPRGWRSGIRVRRSRLEELRA